MTSVESGALRRLSAGELRDYEANGFVVVPEVFRPEDLERLDRQLGLLIAGGRGAEGARSGWIFKPALESEVLQDFASSPRILSLIEDIVKPGIAIHSTKLVTKLPRSDIECHWHQDEAFYTNPDDPSTVSATRMSVWVPLQDSDQSNGCLYAVPGSHRWGLKEYEVQDHGTCIRKLKVDFDFSAAVPLPVSAGSVVLFSAYLWHHSKGNATDRPRRAFITSYQEAGTVAVTGSYESEYRILRPAPA